LATLALHGHVPHSFHLELLAPDLPGDLAELGNSSLAEQDLFHDVGALELGMGIAVTYKADVKSRVGDAIAEKRDRATDKVRSLISGGSEATPSAEDLQHRARRAKGLIQENPLGLAVGRGSRRLPARAAAALHADGG
jgi:hypothetical protein